MREVPITKQADIFIDLMAGYSVDEVAKKHRMCTRWVYRLERRMVDRVAAYCGCEVASRRWRKVFSDVWMNRLTRYMHGNGHPTW